VLFAVIDFGALFSQLPATYWWLPPLLIIAALSKSAWFKGFIGEVMVNLSKKGSSPTAVPLKDLKEA